MYVIITMPKVNDERILKEAREKQLVAYKGAPVRMSADFSTEVLQARREYFLFENIQRDERQEPKPRLL